MLAVITRRPGGPEELELGTVAEPTPSAHQVLIEVHAAGVNRADLLQRRGLYPPEPGESEVLGLECAGVVRGVGSDVRNFAPGDRVMALLGGGGYAEQVVVHERLVLKIPGSLTFEAAACVPEAFLTAQQALLDADSLDPGGRVLIHAGASGVGSAAVQLARELGGFVFATTRTPKKLALLRELGVERPIDGSSEDFAELILKETRGQGVDRIVDLVGGTYSEKNHAVLGTGGRWVMVGLLGGTRANLDLRRLLSKRQTLTGIVLRSLSLTDKAALIQAFRRQLLPWFEDGRLCPVIDSVYSLPEVRDAHVRMETNANLGKIVLKVR